MTSTKLLLYAELRQRSYVSITMASSLILIESTLSGISLLIQSATVTSYDLPNEGLKRSAESVTARTGQNQKSTHQNRIPFVNECGSF